MLLNLFFQYLQVAFFKIYKKVTDLIFGKKIGGLLSGKSEFTNIVKDANHYIFADDPIHRAPFKVAMSKYGGGV